MTEGISPRVNGTGSSSGNRLSYKFQRLREQIREAIVNGEFKGQLPGERELGRRFRANAKTINKALCDLSSEGLLVRIIGRGTFVSHGETSSSESITQTYQIFSQKDFAASPHRRQMFDALRAALVLRGHTLELVPLQDAAETAPIPITAWPTALRRQSSGLVIYPHDPQSALGGHPSDELIAEAWRRHIPVVLLAAASSGPKVHSVMPDYTSAGFCLSEHLFMLGCEQVALLRHRAEGREVDLVVGGCQTAAMRHRGYVVELNMEEGSDWVGGLLGDSSPVASRTTHGPTLGLICVGSRALAAARSDQTIADLIARGALVVTCILEPGDSAAEAADVTSFEFDVTKMAGWAARLLMEARAGQRPVEVIVPGELRVRGRIPTNGRSTRGHAVGSNGRERSNLREQLAEAVV